MKRSFASTTILLTLVTVAALLVAGCGRSWPFQWVASEQTKQAQGLVEDNIDAAEPHTAPAGKPHLKEAKWASRVVTSYVGTPEVRQVPVTGKSAAAIDQAAKDVARPAPNARDVAQAIPTELEESVMPWLDLGILVASMFVPTAGLLTYRKKFQTVLGAFEQTVEGIDNAKLSKAEKAKLRTELAKAQDAKTKVLVTKAKAKVA